MNDITKSYKPIGIECGYIEGAGFPSFVEASTLKEISPYELTGRYNALLAERDELILDRDALYAALFEIEALRGDNARHLALISAMNSPESLQAQDRPTAVISCRFCGNQSECNMYPNEDNIVFECPVCFALIYSDGEVFSNGLEIDNNEH